MVLCVTITPIRYIDPTGLVQVNFVDYIAAMGGEVTAIDPRDGKARVSVTVDGKTSTWTLGNGKMDDTKINERFGFSSYLTEGERKSGYGIGFGDLGMFKEQPGLGYHPIKELTLTHK